MKIKIMHFNAKDGEFTRRNKHNTILGADVVTIAAHGGHYALSIKNPVDQHVPIDALTYTLVRLDQAYREGKDWTIAAPSEKAIKRAAKRSGFKSSKSYMTKLFGLVLTQ